MTPPKPRATPGADPAPAPLTLQAFQAKIEELYGPRDRARGVDGTFIWFVEEVGELARAVKRQDPVNLREEFSDVLAWLVTLGSLHGIDMEDAARRYVPACPRCHAAPCTCPAGRKT